MSEGLNRVHDRLDEVLNGVSDIRTDVAVIRAENGAVKATVAALTAGQVEHDKRIANLEHDRSRLTGVLTGVGIASATGGVGAGAILRLLGVIP